MAVAVKWRKLHISLKFRVPPADKLLYYWLKSSEIVLAPKRTQEIIRALLNFYSWSDERVAEIIEKRKEVAERMKKLVELAQNKEQLRQQLNSISMEIPRIQDETKEVFLSIGFVS